MLHLLISIIGILITIIFVIGTHESAHFIVARLVGIKVLRFSIGFGKTLWRRRDKKGTEYVLSLIPLGGYVQMLDESEGNVPSEERHMAYNTQPYYKKLLVVSAGPLINIFCALVLYWVIFITGFTTIKPVIGSVEPGSIAARAGLEHGQEIVMADQHPVSSWSSMILRLIAHAGDQDRMSITVESPVDHSRKSLTLDLQKWQLDGLTPDPLMSLGITPFTPGIPLIIGVIAEQSPAAKSGLRVNDKIISIGKQPIADWEKILSIIQAHPDETLSFTVERQGKTVTLPVSIGHQRSLLLQKSGYLGISPSFTWPESLLNKVQYGPVQAIPHAWGQVYDFTYFNFLLVAKLITGKLSLQSLGGPITIFDTAGTALNYGFLAFIGFLAFLSVSIGVINLLPIPGLDGGHLFLQTIEFIIRRPVPEKVLSVLYRLGFSLIILVLAISLVNDLLRMY